MACSKYILTNTGSTIVTFNYQRCSDTQWQYQVELSPNETKNIWSYNNTLEIAQLFTTSIVINDVGTFPTPQWSMTTGATPMQACNYTGSSMLLFGTTLTIGQTLYEDSDLTDPISPGVYWSDGTTWVLTQPLTGLILSAGTCPDTAYFSSGSTSTNACLASFPMQFATPTQFAVGEYMYFASFYPTFVAPPGFYSDGTTWYEVTGVLGQITSTGSC